MFWSTPVPICVGISIRPATNGTLTGSIAFLVLYNIFTTAVRWIGVTKGYALGIIMKCLPDALVEVF